jgi:high affinity Mn2+ porin
VGIITDMPMTRQSQALRLSTLTALALASTLAATKAMASTEATTAPTQREAAPDRFALHWQATFVEQAALGFHAPYHGPNSLKPAQDRETTDVTLYLGAQPFPGTEIWLNPEADQGFGLSDTLGAAGFPSGEAYKVGKNQPYFRLQRLFVRQTFDLPGDRESVEDGANQFATERGVNRLVFTLGKISVGDLFDANQYSHDPRGDFLNWAAIDAGTFDYAADAWGYTVGAAAEWYQGDWTLRLGVFDLSDVPNSPRLESGLHELQGDFEIERRFQLAARPGKVRLTVFDSYGRMGLLSEAVAQSEATSAPPDIAAVRRYRSRLGVSLDLEQQVAEALGLFARLGKAQGNVETYEFTDIDRTASVGLSLKGPRWGRADDTVGLVAIDNRISGDRQRFLNAGGLGILIGDGQLPHPRAEQIIESYYQLSVWQHIQLTLDYQWINHPAYNADRGPVSVIAGRFHVQF